MEDVLEVSPRPFAAKRPVVCFDESHKPQIIELQVPLPREEGHPQRSATEYERNGVSTRCMFVAPFLTWRHVKVTNQRTAIDGAPCMKDLVAIHFPDADTIILPEDNRNTHTPASVYAAFPPEEAKRIGDRLEFHYTPKHGSWRTMAERALRVVSRQCRDRRIPNQPTVIAEGAAWETRRNASGATVHWRFTTADARIKLHKLYPVREPITP